MKEEAITKGHEYYFDPEVAKFVIEFFSSYLKHIKGRFAGKPFEPLDWQAELLATMFGWLRVDNGKRRFRQCYISTAKKNGKSTLLSGIAIYLTIADQEMGSEVYSVATDVSQASIVFRECQLMIQASPELSRRLEINASRRNISDMATSSFYRVLPGTDFRVEGINSHAILFDELHAQRDRRLFDSLKYSGSSREQSISIYTTTAGFNKQSICYETYSYAKQVMRDPSFDNTFLPYVCEPANPEDWKTEDAWKAANPSWGETVMKDVFETDFKEAESSNIKQNSFRRYRVNQWVAQSERWLNMDQWEKCNLPPNESLEGRECWMGLDLASTYDTSAAVLVFPDEDGCYDVLCKFWIPAENAEQREVRDRIPYTTWLKDKSTGLTATPGNVTDYDFIRRDINDLREKSKFNIKRILIDRWNATQLAIQLDSDQFEVAGFSQGFGSMSAPTKLLENLVASGKLRHNGNKVLSYMASVVSVKQDPAGNIRPVKPSKGSTDRIDGIVALVMALGGHANERPEEPDATPEILVL